MLVYPTSVQGLDLSGAAPAGQGTPVAVSSPAPAPTAAGGDAQVNEVASTAYLNGALRMEMYGTQESMGADGKPYMVRCRSRSIVVSPG